MALEAAASCRVWPVDRTCWSIPDGTSETLITAMQRVATEYLWAMTGRRIGPDCPVTVRPCRKRCADAFSFLWQGQFLGAGYQFTGPFIPYMVDGQMRNATFCGCVSDCNCGPELCTFELPGPIYQIDSIYINGTLVDPATYTVQDSGTVVRLSAADGTNPCWPDCQDMTVGDLDDGAFSVTYSTGLAVPQMGVLAATKLTEHLIRGCSGNGCGCGTGTRQNLQRLSRQGVDLEFADPQELFDDGRTGIEAVDWFIRAMNPYGLASPMRVLSPDAPQRAPIRRSSTGPALGGV